MPPSKALRHRRARCSSRVVLPLPGVMESISSLGVLYSSWDRKVWAIHSASSARSVGCATTM